MTSIKNEKTVLVAIVVIAAVLAVSTMAIGNGRMVLAADTTTVTKNVDNTGINVQTHTSQKQQCDTAGGSSPIVGGATIITRPLGSCSAGSLDRINQTGGELTK